VHEITLDGLRLDVSSLPLKVRNRLLHAGYEAQEKQMCLDYLTREDSVLELGGAIGYLALICQKQIGIRNYFICEANPRTVEILKRNFALNGLVPAVTHVALAPKDGQVDLEIEGDFWDHSIVPGRSEHGRKTMTVPAATLDTLLQTIRCPVNALLIDIEGAEQFIAFEQLPENINKIIIELHPKVLGPSTMYNLIARLIHRGFHVAREHDGTFVFLKTMQSKISESPITESLATSPSLQQILQRNAAGNAPAPA
jgi:FkbM family methyltransferase